MCEVKCCEEVPIMGAYFAMSEEECYRLPLMFRRVPEKIEKYEKGNVFVCSKLGAIKLSIEDPLNELWFYQDYVEIYSNETKETTFIKHEEITGFVFEQREAALEGEEFLEDLEELKL